MENQPIPPSQQDNDTRRNDTENPALSRLSGPLRAVCEKVLAYKDPPRRLCDTWENRERAERAERLRAFLGEVGPRLASATLDNYVCDCPRQEETLKALEDYAENMEEEVSRGNCVILFGPSGTGKDHLLIALARIAILRYGYSVKHVYGVDLFSELRDRMEDSAPEELWVQRLVRPAILILSDPIPPRGGLTDFQGAMLQRIVNKRYTACRPTWTTLNVTCSAEADSLLSAAIVDRLKDGALARFCDWPSHRRTRSLDDAGNERLDAGESWEP